MFFPAAWAALAYNTVYVINRRLRWTNAMLRALAGAVLWLGTIALMRWTPWPVGDWWID